MIETQTQEVGVNPELTPEQLEIILAPDDLLASTAIDRDLAEIDPSSEEYERRKALLEFQKAYVLEPDEGVRFTMAHSFVRSQGRYATWANQGDGTLPSLHYEVNGIFVPIRANQERWHLLGIDPAQLEGGEQTARYIESAWAKLRSAEQALASAQDNANSARALVSKLLPQ